MIKSLYIVTPGGTPLYYFDAVEGKEQLADAILFTGLITAIQNFMVEIKIGNPQKFSTTTSEVYIETTKCFGVVLIKEVEDKISSSIVKTFLSELVNQLKEIIPEEDACSYVDDELGKEIRVKIESLFPRLEKIKEEEITEKMKENLW